MENFPESKKAQTAIEFVILVGFLMFFFVLFYLAIQGNMADKTREKEDMVVREVNSIVKSEIDLASSSTDGYYREFSIPEKILNLDYDITLTQGMVYLKTKDNKHAAALPVLPVTGQIAKGKNLIKKINGEVFLNE